MKSLCDTVQKELALEGASGLDAELKTHFDNCLDCQTISKALREIDAGAAKLTHYDASDKSVEELLVKVSERPSRIKFGYLAASASLVLALACVTFINLSLRSTSIVDSTSARISSQLAHTNNHGYQTDTVLHYPNYDSLPYEPAFTTVSMTAHQYEDMVETGHKQPLSSEKLPIAPGNRAINLQIDALSGVEGWARPGTRVDVALTYNEGGQLTTKIIAQNLTVVSHTANARPHTPFLSSGGVPAPSTSVTLDASPNDAMTLLTARKLGTLSLVLRGSHDSGVSAVTTDDLISGTASGRLGKDRDICGTVKMGDQDFVLKCGPGRGLTTVGSPTVAAVQPRPTRTIAVNAGGNSAPPAPIPDLSSFWSLRSVTEGLQFKNPSGYWANTYVPGDPIAAELSLALSSSGRALIQSMAGITHPLDTASEKVLQPFDPPKSGGMALYLHSDKSSIDGKTRTLLQVGLKGASIPRGPRPPLNAALVLDPSDVPAAAEREMFKAVIEAFERDQAIGDKFSVIVAGKGGGVLIKPGELRHGTAAVAIQNLFPEADKMGGSPVTLKDALALAAKQVSSADTIGNSAVLLATGSRYGNEIDAILQAVHELTLKDTSISVISLGQGASRDELRRIALAGQGRRAEIQSRDNAEEVISRELKSASRVVARALRVNIQLGAGVKLVDVLGSYPLDVKATAAAKAVEKHLDRKIAKVKGIEADRGKDDGGIQILIPAFYADDSHTILLDVVAEQPGRLAEVTLAYKDMVGSRNDKLQAELALGRTPQDATRLELNVTKNFLAHHTSTVLRRAAQLVKKQRVAAAEALLGDFTATISALQSTQQLPSGDPELEKDKSMMLGYIEILGKTQGWPPSHIAHLAASLELAGRYKIFPRSEFF
ncbi:MAG: Flp pilus assembly protein CpaB [Deltaproteobacteria bacterium]|nr:Flp pilus assembly protein CpaB [Deltaproteobacteria bacterium]